MGFIEDKRFIQYGARCLFFDRHEGVSDNPFDSLNVSFNVGDNPSNVKNNIEIVRQLANADKIFTINQVHSDLIIKYGDNIKDADGVYTKEKCVFLGIRFADCVPIVFMDIKQKIIMVVHAGWKGTHLGIAEKACEILFDEGCNPDNILVSIGPHICKNCYEVKEDVASKFGSCSIKKKDGKIFLDLEKANIVQLEGMGIKKENIESMGICTYENRDFFSYRRDKKCGRNIGGILLV